MASNEQKVVGVRPRASAVLIVEESKKREVLWGTCLRFSPTNRETIHVFMKLELLHSGESTTPAFELSTLMLE